MISVAHTARMILVPVMVVGVVWVMCRDALAILIGVVSTLTESTGEKR